MKITYLEHSGYMAEVEGRILVFDYYKGTLPKLPEKAKIYVFASHVHSDHFNKQIFDWQGRYTDIHYILSDDIKADAPEGRCTLIGPCREITLDGMEIRTLKSTDEGVAFLVRVGEQVIYHAGDLNWWHWEEESAAYNEMMKRKYQYEISRIGDIPIDVAFVPLDPRQEKQYDWGMDYFMKHTDTRCVFPMHMWGDYSVCGRLKTSEGASAYADRFQSIEAPGQVFEIL